MTPGTAVYLHPAGHKCSWNDLPSGALIVILGVVQDDGSIFQLNIWTDCTKP